MICIDNQGRSFQIDEEDEWVLDVCTWHVDDSNSDGYVKWKVKGVLTTLHLLLLGKQANGKQIDHKDRDKTNNKRANLRVVSRSVNMLNKPCHRNNKLGIKGIQERNGKYRVRIMVDGKSMSRTFTHLEAAKCFREQTEEMVINESMVR